VTTHALEPGGAIGVRGIDLHLWLVALDDEAERDDGRLIDDELQRAARFVRDSDRRRYLASHAALRRVLGSSTPWPAGVHGKPASASAPYFNLSRRDGVALIGVSTTHEIGVDVETLRRIDDAQSLADLHFTPRERAAVAAAPGRERDSTFLRVWTRKEACMKATGRGLSLAPSSFECGASPDSATVHVDVDGQFWTLLVHSPDATAHGAVAAWAVVLAAGTAAVP
jgi:4'-phosphopantetheinyl transferase